MIYIVIVIDTEKMEDYRNMKENFYYLLFSKQKSVLCIQELDHFGYILLLVSLKSSPLSCVLKYLVFSKEKTVN